ncbi:hypothetical protein U1Q18_050124 [Sarracenia purpurea var. burkii]
MAGTPEKIQTNPPSHEPSSAPSATAAPPPSSSLPAEDTKKLPAEDTKKWGTHVMGPPAVPTVHPDNQKAGTWSAADHQLYFHQHHPYLQYSPIDKSNNNPLESVIHMFNFRSREAETMAEIFGSIVSLIFPNVVFFHLINYRQTIKGTSKDLTTRINAIAVKMGPSPSETAWGKVNLTVKAITEGGFESLFKHTFPTEPNEKLKNTFACYLSTTTGPVTGTLYLSTVRVAFCSDRPLSFAAPSGQEDWTYYKATIPVANIATVNPVEMDKNPPQKYLQIVTIDGHNFWFMGFVNFEKSLHHVLDTLSDFRAASATPAAQPQLLPSQLAKD